MIVRGFRLYSSWLILVDFILGDSDMRTIKLFIFCASIIAVPSAFAEEIDCSKTWKYGQPHPSCYEADNQRRQQALRRSQQQFDSVNECLQYGTNCSNNSGYGGSDRY